MTSRMDAKVQGLDYLVSNAAKLHPCSMTTALKAHQLRFSGWRPDAVQDRAKVAALREFRVALLAALQQEMNGQRAMIHLRNGLHTLYCLEDSLPEVSRLQQEPETAQMIQQILEYALPLAAGGGQQQEHAMDVVQEGMSLLSICVSADRLPAILQAPQLGVPAMPSAAMLDGIMRVMQHTMQQLMPAQPLTVWVRDTIRSMKPQRSECNFKSGGSGWEEHPSQ